MHPSSDIAMPKSKALHAVLEQEALVVKGTESALLRFPRVQLVQLGADAAIDCQVLGGAMQLRQVVGVLELLLGRPLDPFAALLLDNRWVGACILQHLKRIHLGGQPDELDDRLSRCLILELSNDLQA